MKLATLMFAVLVAIDAQAATREEQLLDAVRAGDTAAVKALLDQGVPVDTKFRYDRTALSFAADRGHVEIVKLLLERGADPDTMDSFYHQSAIGGAARKGHVEVVLMMLERGKRSVGPALLGGIFGKQARMRFFASRSICGSCLTSCRDFFRLVRTEQILKGTGNQGQEQGEV